MKKKYNISKQVQMKARELANDYNFVSTYQYNHAQLMKHFKCAPPRAVWEMTKAKTGVKANNTCMKYFLEILANNGWY
ncbi:hypothetical protein [Neomegalonema sp.]|uniref:hypothetical protein n=1 Tax=Neomegalonema sp. TaxID=2039713 RepID=UPI0026364792|nr:hypothetical protein [Neomegalonema sp.]MDD2869624.1 hypothetical protein [Neomegalonema sp.]